MLLKFESHLKKGVAEKAATPFLSNTDYCF
jgi:hypothetical protein